ncbi:MAG: GNAT family N-acetyltransferase [Vicinamibacterales bacterium]
MTSPTPFVDLRFARRLEHAEASGGVAFVEARSALEPERGATWINRHGAYAMFDGGGSPVTQTFGLGLDGAVTSEDLDALEAFFHGRQADINHEVSPLAGAGLFSTLSSRGYSPVELTSVMYRTLEGAPGIAAPINQPLHVRQISIDESEMFGITAARGWSELAELHSFLEGFGRVMATRANSPCFVAELDGRPIATAVLVVANGVAVLAGASTIPEYRRQGAQLALLDARLRFAASEGCQLAMMGAAPGSASQRNAERHGFRIAYTRVKWCKRFTGLP